MKDKAEMTERGLLEEISSKLDQLVGLLACQGKDLDTQIRVLRGFGFDWPFIGLIVGLEADAARMRFSRKRKT